MTGMAATSALHEQLQALRAQIRQQPGQAALRVHYFQLLCVLGEWSKALAQLQLCAQLDPKAVPMARAYREVIRCEVLRSEVFAGRRRPFLIGEPPPWLAWLLDALALQAQGQAEAAHALRAQALEQAPATPGQIGEQPFAWLADSDTRLGPVVELIAQGNYYWLPLHSLQHIDFEPVQDLRDLVWLPCAATLAHGGELQGFMPTRYPLAGHGDATDDDALKLARRTEWTALGADHQAGHGQRSWVADTDDFAMLQVRRIVLTGTAQAQA